MSQLTFVKSDRLFAPSGTCSTSIRKISNPHLFGGLLSFEELASRSREVFRWVPSLASARGLSHADALLIACIHRVAHHYDSERLIWLYDLHLLLERASEEDLGLFVRMAVEKRVAAICVRGVDLAQQRFHTTLSAKWLDRLRQAAKRLPCEPSAAYLDTHHRQVESLLWDLRGLPRWRDRARLLRQHLLPSRACRSQSCCHVRHEAALPFDDVQRACSRDVQMVETGGRIAFPRVSLFPSNRVPPI